MFSVYFLLQDRRQGVVPTLFETRDDAWYYIHDVMTHEGHPAFMWVREVNKQ